jgi:hygromycin-B 7''-O-kinase
MREGRPGRMLPHITCRADYVAVYADTPVWLPAMRAICVRHELDASALRRGALGTHVVFHAGPQVIKLFCPLWEGDVVAERAVLEHVRGLPTPELVAQGQVEGWPYIVMTCVPGTPAGAVWDHLDRGVRIDVVRQLGGLMRTLHSQPPLAELATDWDAFLRERIARCDSHHSAPEPWRSWIRERVEGFSEPPFDPVLLSADITDDHVLLGVQEGRWRITGLIDFGDAMMGHPHYEFVASLGCYTFGQPELSRGLVEAYGLALTPELAERLTTYCLLHKFARLEDFLQRCPVGDGPGFWRALWGDL